MKRETNDGTQIEVSDLSNGHLANIYKLVQKYYKQGITVQVGGGFCPEDYWYDEDEYIGEEIFVYNPVFKEIVDEYDRRFNSGNLDFLSHGKN